MRNPDGALWEALAARGSATLASSRSVGGVLHARSAPFCDCVTPTSSTREPGSRRHSPRGVRRALSMAGTKQVPTLPMEAKKGRQAPCLERCQRSAALHRASHTHTHREREREREREEQTALDITHSDPPPGGCRGAGAAGKPGRPRQRPLKERFYARSRLRGRKREARGSARARRIAPQGSADQGEPHGAAQRGEARPGSVPPPGSLGAQAISWLQGL